MKITYQVFVDASDKTVNNGGVHKVSFAIRSSTTDLFSGNITCSGNIFPSSSTQLIGKKNIRGVLLYARLLLLFTSVYILDFCALRVCANTNSNHTSKIDLSSISHLVQFGNGTLGAIMDFRDEDPSKHRLLQNNIMTDDNIHYAAYQWVVNNEYAMAEYGDIQFWDVSSVTNLVHAFGIYNPFAGNDPSNWRNWWNRGFSTDLSFWDTRQVVDMAGLFMAAVSFAGNVSQWNTSRVTNMEVPSGKHQPSMVIYRNGILVM